MCARDKSCWLCSCDGAACCAGRIKWARSLHSHLGDLVLEASSHPVLKTLPLTSEVLRRYNVVSTALVNYEAEMKDTWMKQNVSTVSKQ